PMPERLRARGEELKARLDEVASAVEKLTGDGWDVDLVLDDLDLYCPNIPTGDGARQRLIELGIDPDLIDIHEHGDGADEDDEDGGVEDDEDDEDGQVTEIDLTHAATQQPCELERKLLSLGGEGVDRRCRTAHHAALILAGGQVFDLPVTMKRGK